MKWVKCTSAKLSEFVKENNLICKNDGMHTVWFDQDGNEKAKRMHGFVSDEYSIFTTENEETLMVVSQIINRYDR